MSFFQDNQFNANSVDTTDNFEPIPEGNYRVLVASAEEKPTANGQGQGLNVQYEVVDGNYKGRKLFHWINLRNANKIAEEIGHKELARLCIATNVPQPRSCAEFCGKLIQVVVKVGERNGERRNEIKSIVIPDKAADAATAAVAGDVYAATNAVYATPTTAPQQATDAPAWGQ